MANINQAIEYAKQNPNSAYATELRTRIESGKLNTELQTAGLNQYIPKNSTQNPETPQQSTYLDRVKEGYTQGAQDVTKAVQTGADAQTDPNKNAIQKAGALAETGLNTVGGVAKAAFTPITAALEPAVKPLIEKITSIPGVANKVSELSAWATKHPQAATDLNSVVNIAGLGVGGAAENVAKDVAIKTGEGISKAASDVAKVGKDIVIGTNKAGSIAGEAVLGSQGQEAAIQAYKNPEQVSNFINKKSTLESVANEARQGVSKIQDTSIKNLQAVKDAAPDITIPRSTYVNTFKQKIADFIGVDSSKLTDNNLAEHLSQTGFGEAEAGVIQRLTNKISNWKDTSIKGLLDLKSSIAKTGFYKGLPDHVNSDKFVKVVNDHIKDLITKEEHGGFAPLTPALKKASDSIDFLDKIKANILGSGGKNIESAANKLNILMSKLSDPLQKEATIKLLDRFKKETGVDLVNTLNSARAAKVIEAPLAGFKNPLKTLQGLADRGAGRAAIKLGKNNLKK